MGSDCVSLHQERSCTMRWRCLGFLLLITVTGVQLLGDETAEASLNQLRESEEQSLADVYVPLVKRETQNKKKNGKKVGQKKRTKKTKANRSVGGKKNKNLKNEKRNRKNGKKNADKKGGKKRRKSVKNSKGKKSGRKLKKNQK